VNLQKQCLLSAFTMVGSRQRQLSCVDSATGKHRQAESGVLAWARALFAAAMMRQHLLCSCRMTLLLWWVVVEQLLAVYLAQTDGMVVALVELPSTTAAFWIVRWLD
jgi:urea transporter